MDKSIFFVLLIEFRLVLLIGCDEAIRIDLCSANFIRLLDRVIVTIVICVLGLFWDTLCLNNL
jgi:hypothetical protein